MLYPRAEYGNRQAVAGSEEVALREPAACGGREIDRVALSQTCEGIVRDRGSALESVSKVALRPLDHAALNGLHVGKRRCLALLVVQQADQERAEDLHQIGLSARSPVDLMGYRVGNRIGREAGSRLRQQPGRRGQIEKGKLDLPRADEMIVPDAVELIERRCSGDQQAHASAMLDGGAEQAHQLEELQPAAGEEILQPLKLVNGDENRSEERREGKSVDLGG